MSEKELEIEVLKRKRLFWSLILQVIILFVIGAVTLIILNGTTDIFKQQGVSKVCSPISIQYCLVQNECEKNGLYWWENSCHISQKIEQIQSEFLDYNSLKDLKSITLIENFVSWTPDNKMEDTKTFNGVVLKQGKIAKGYIEFIVSAGGKPFGAWESIYFKALPFTQYHYLYGAHILRLYSLKTPIIVDKTHLLYPLNNIPFTTKVPYSDSNPITGTLDLFNLINLRKDVDFMAFVSALTPAKIDSIKLYYECDLIINNGQCELTTK